MNINVRAVWLRYINRCEFSVAKALSDDFRAGPRTVRHSGDIALLVETNKNEVVCESNINTKRS